MPLGKINHYRYYNNYIIYQLYQSEQKALSFRTNLYLNKHNRDVDIIMQIDSIMRPLTKFSPNCFYGRTTWGDHHLGRLILIRRKYGRLA